MKPKLLIVELWGLGDLIIATPFLRAASEHFEITLLAKPFALDLQPRLWPNVRIVPFTAPWTAFKGKYKVWNWPWLRMFRIYRQLRSEHFDAGVSARWDPRNHLLLALIGAKNRLGFPRWRSGFLLNQSLSRPAPDSHVYESWRAVARALNLTLPDRDNLVPTPSRGGKTVLIHTGAGQQVRVWPVENYKRMAQNLRSRGFTVQIACDPQQHDWWRQSGEKQVAIPANVTELIALIDQAGVFVGNDSGPGHLAAFCGIPTFTFFGPQLPEWFAPLHPGAEWIEGKACPYKPCSDYCRFPTPHCLWNISEEEAWTLVEKFVKKNLNPTDGKTEWTE